jgi:hypothetical protein
VIEQATVFFQACAIPPLIGKIDHAVCGMSEHVFMVDVLKYAVVERERRFVVAGIPEGVTQTFRIEDYYIEHTRLRLRRVMAADGSLDLPPARARSPLREARFSPANTYEGSRRGLNSGSPENSAGPPIMRMVTGLG